MTPPTAPLAVVPPRRGRHRRHGRPQRRRGIARRRSHGWGAAPRRPHDWPVALARCRGAARRSTGSGDAPLQPIADAPRRGSAGHLGRGGEAGVRGGEGERREARGGEGDERGSGAVDAPQRGARVAMAAPRRHVGGGEVVTAAAYGGRQWQRRRCRNIPPRRRGRAVGDAGRRGGHVVRHRPPPSWHAGACPQPRQRWPAPSAACAALVVACGRPAHPLAAPASRRRGGGRRGRRRRGRRGGRSFAHGACAALRRWGGGCSMAPPRLTAAASSRDRRARGVPRVLADGRGAQLPTVHVV